MSFLSGFASGAQTGLQLGGDIQDFRHKRATDAGEKPAASGLYSMYRDARDQRDQSP